MGMYEVGAGKYIRNSKVLGGKSFVGVARCRGFMKIQQVGKPSRQHKKIVTVHWRQAGFTILHHPL